MSFFQEYSLLIAVATPVSTLAAMNLALALAGERGTLLLPAIARYPRVDRQDEAAVLAATVINDVRQALPAGSFEALTRNASPANSCTLHVEAKDAA